ncbi:MAG: glutamate--tRNA ligase [Chitinophagales bacterium]
MATRTRFAPSPTGPLHIGGLRTALFCYLHAKNNQGDFILRIEDTDQKRFVPGAEEYILESLSWCGITPDEGPSFGGEYGPYRQSERSALYKPFVEQLLRDGYAYYAFDTSEELSTWRESMQKQGNASPKYSASTRAYLKNSLSLSDQEVNERIQRGDDYVVRFKTPVAGEVRFYDDIRGWIVFQCHELDDKVLMKSDGLPTYHLANVVDDHLMEITDVIRGEEWLPSTPLHVQLYEALGWTMPKFAHLPLILKPDGKGKLSKRDGDRLGFPVFPIDWYNPDNPKELIAGGYKERGFEAPAILNFLALLGWNPGNNQELFSLNELIEDFSLERVNKSGAKFDYQKACWFNSEYLKNYSREDKLRAILSIFPSAAERSEQEVELVFDLSSERIQFKHEIKDTVSYLFEKPTALEGKGVNKAWKAEKVVHLEECMKRIQHADTEFSAVNLEGIIKQYIQEKSISFGQILPPLRLSLTGTLQGPSIFQIMSFLGLSECLERVELAKKIYNS